MGIQIEIVPAGIMDLAAITKMTNENMFGADQRFTAIISGPLGFLFGNLVLPLNLLFSGSGYLALYDDKRIGCAYLNLEHRCGFVFNVSVLSAFRRQGVGRKLMEHLEQLTRQSGRRWMALQVDNGNIAAQTLYERLNYLPYHPHYYFGSIRDLAKTRTDDNASVERVPVYEGRRLFNRFLDMERAEGDAWASPIIGDLVPSPATSGTFYRCSLEGDLVGCIQLVTRGNCSAVNLVLRPDQWGKWIDATTLSPLLDVPVTSAYPLELYLGSSAHHRSLALLLGSQNFEERVISRILMLKRIAT